MDFDQFTEQERSALVLMRAYEKIRAEKQFGYRAFKTLNPEVIHTPLFKQLQTVAAWLKSCGFTVTWTERHWQGFVDFAFKSFGDQIPQPGQLRNQNILKRYLRSVADERPDELTDEKLARIYEKVLCRSILDNPKVLQALKMNFWPGSKPRKIG